MRDVSELERQILEQELEVIREGLVNVNENLKKVFEKYGILEGQHKKEFVNYVLSGLISADENYYVKIPNGRGAYKTMIKVETQTSKIPDDLKKIILKRAVKDFMSKINNIYVNTGWTGKVC